MPGSEDLDSMSRRMRQLEHKNSVLARQLRDAQEAVKAAGMGIVPDAALDASSGVAEAAEDTNDDGEGSQMANNNNDVGKQLYSLSLHAGHPKQYLGSASGAILANILGIKGQLTQPQGDYNNDEDQLTRFPHASSTGEFIRTNVSEAAKAGSPAEAIARRLLAAYLSHDHLAYPYLDPKKLINILTMMYSTENYCESHPVDAFAMDMIFAIATVQVHRFSWYAVPDAEMHHERAISRLGGALQSGGLIALQALMLLCQYRMLSVANDASASLWHLLGMATRLGIELGLHREASYQWPPDVAPGDEDRVKRELDIKRRCFWSLFSMDRIVSNTLGRPVAINLLEIDTEYPRIEDDADESSSLCSSPSIEDILREDPPWPANTRIFNHIVQHRVITGKILSQLHNMPRSKMTDPLASVGVKQQLADELNQWRSGVASLPLVDTRSIGGGGRSMDKSNYRTRAWYDLLYHNCILMLHRPIHSLQDVPQTSEVLTQIYRSARESIAAYSALHRARKINYGWLTLHAVFIVGLSYLYALRIHFQNKRRHMQALATGTANVSSTPLGGQVLPEPPIGQCVGEMRACSTLLVALSERWNTNKGCHEVFACLSDAILADQAECSTGIRPPGLSSSSASLSSSSFFPSSQRWDASLAALADDGQQQQQQQQQQFMPQTPRGGGVVFNTMMDFDRSYLDYFKEFQDLFGDAMLTP
jgi:hypothetical protein